MQSSRPDIFCLFVHQECHRRDFIDCFFCEFDFDPFCFQKRLVLLEQRVFRNGQDLNKRFFIQIFQFDTDREASLQFRDQIRRFAVWKAPAPINRM